MSNLENIYKEVTKCPFDSERTCPVLSEKAESYVNSDRSRLQVERLLAGSVWRTQELLRRQGEKIPRRPNTTGCDVVFDEA